jgi:hypothetical protein
MQYVPATVVAQLGIFHLKRILQRAAELGFTHLMYALTYFPPTARISRQDLVLK